MKSKLNIFVYSIFLVLIIAIFLSVFFIPFSETNNAPSLSSEPFPELLVSQAPAGLRTGHFEAPAKPTAVLGTKIEKAKTKNPVKQTKAPVKKPVVKKIVKQKIVPAKKATTTVKQVKTPAKSTKVTAKKPSAKQTKAPSKQAVAKKAVSVLKLNLNANSFIITPKASEIATTTAVSSAVAKTISSQPVANITSGKTVSSPASGGKVSGLGSSGGSVSAVRSSGGGGGGGSSPAPVVTYSAPVVTIPAPVIVNSAPVETISVSGLAAATSSATSTEIASNYNLDQNVLIITSNASSSVASSSVFNNTASSSIASSSVSDKIASSSIVTINYNFGLSMGESLSWMDEQTLNTTFDSFTSLGIGWVRMDFSWASIQPATSTVYDWTNIDRVVAAANARNLKILPILAYTPVWARPSGCNDEKCAPADPAQFASFASEAAKRYSSQGIHTWEIWNEPNISMFWQPAPDANKYSNLLISASVAIKIQDPQAKIITGGLSAADTTGTDISPTDFLSRIYQNSTKPFFDAVGMHPYTYPFLTTDRNPWSAWLQMYFTKPSLLSIMEQYGDSEKQIWLTEFGAPTGGPGLQAMAATNDFSGQYDHVSEDLQAQMITNAVNDCNSLSFAGPLFWYSYQDLGTTAETNENFFGLVRYDGSHKPAYDVFKNLISAQ